jgi:REP element-mobilizing transposase RayT
VTVCTVNRQCCFGDIVDGQIYLTDVGQIVERTLLELPSTFPHVELDCWVIMPNHVHIIVILTDAPEGGSQRKGGSRTAPTRRKPLGRVIGAFKTMSSKQINRIQDTGGERVWQRNYYEHIIRDEKSLEKIREYIVNNPARWSEDRENPFAGWA